MKLKTILIAPDKFKGSLTSKEVCEIIADALLEEMPGVNVITLPLADGGEGTCELLTMYSGGSFEEVEVHDPLLKKIKSKFGLSADRKTAFIEMAAASGLQLLAEGERNPMRTSTLGTGEMIRYAIELGVTDIVLGIGGSATNDGGMGIAQALGLQVYDSSGEEMKVMGGNLTMISGLHVSKIHPGLRDVSFTLICDVDNPLYGSDGAAHVFASQKGASPSDIVHLDNGLRHLENILVKNFKVDLKFPGAGAGGGVAVALKSLANVTLLPGIKFIADFTKLESKIIEADVVITGEGHLDEQTLSGKVVKGVADLARRYNKPVVAIAGKNSLKAGKISSTGIATVFELMSGGMKESYALRNAEILLRNLLRREVVAWLRKH